MKKIGVVTDSHSGIGRKEAGELGIKVLPMPFYIENECYFENLNLARGEFFKRLEAGEKVSTSQPSPESVMKIWDEALAEYEKILYLPISSGLSGSCMTAVALAQYESYEGRVLVVDNGRVSAPLHRSVLDALELIEKGHSAEEIKEKLEKYKNHMSIYVGVDTLEYLKKGGRISSTTATVGGLLNIKPILRLDVGKLEAYQNCRGTAKMRKAMIEAMRHDLDTRFKKWFDRGEVHLLAASSSNKEVTESWIREIEAAFPRMKVMCDDLSLGVCCHVGPGGLGIGCSCRPR